MATNNQKNEPKGIFKRFETTTKTIFGTDPAEHPLRWARAIEKYLKILVEYLQLKRGIPEKRAEDLVIDFLQEFLSSAIIQQPTWGRFRFWLSRALLHYVDHRHRDERRGAARLLNYVEDARTFIVDDILHLELRQIRKAIELGIVDWFIGQGVALHELTPQDIDCWYREVFDGIDRKALAKKHGVSVWTVGRSIKKVDDYVSRHAAEARHILRAL